MQQEILANLDNPVQLEQLYRANKSAFKKAFNLLAPELKDNKLLAYWDARLNFVKEEISFGSRREWLFVMVACVLGGLIAKIPDIFDINEEYFYTRNIGFTVLPALSAYFAWKNKLPAGKILFIASASLLSLLFINLLPDYPRSDSIALACIHLVLFLWSVLGFSYVGEKSSNVEKRLGYLSYNGDLVVMTTLLLIAGAILSGITIGLFSLIGFNIERFYFDNVIKFALPAAPILGTYLTQANPQLVGKVSPVIAKIFSPLVLLMLSIYLIAIVYSGKDPYNDREFLMIFNALLIGVMAIIFFSVAESSKTGSKKMETWILFLLSCLTIIVNVIAVSAILFRISEWGLSPNRAAVLGGNVLILINLLMVTVQLFRAATRKTTIDAVGKVISIYLPIYCAWTCIVTFLFPFLFGFK